MYNNAKPLASELPSSRQLLRSTIIALVVAIALLIAVVLPAEYAIDPTGIGRALGLTDMGKIKTQLAEEAAADAAMDAGGGAAAAATVTATAAMPQPTAPATAAPVVSNAWRDEMRVELAPGEGAEVKLVMRANQEARFAWIAEGGVVNFDLHGDGGSNAVSYEKGRGEPSDEGTLKAAFDGNHGWFWRNRGDGPVVIIVRTAGDYAEMKRVM